MLIITQGASNSLYCTVSGLSSAGSDQYRFVFIHDQQKKEIEVTLTDISDHPDRYNLFTFIEGTDADLTKKGQYKYQVYDADDVLVETGKALVITSQEAITYTHMIPSTQNFIHS